MSNAELKETNMSNMWIGILWVCGVCSVIVIALFFAVLVAVFSSTPMNPEYGSLTAGANFHCVRGVSSLCDRLD